MKRTPPSPVLPALQVFALPMLPADTWLLLDRRANTAIFCHLKKTDEERSLLAHSFRLTPSAMRIFVLLLQSYPAFCPYRALFQALYPLAPGQEANRLWQQELARRPIRRAMGRLAPALRGLGLEAVSLRDRGYMLAPLGAERLP